MAAVVGCLVPPGIPPTCLGLGLPSNSYNPRSNPCLAPATPRRCNQPEAEFPQLSAVKDPTLPHPFNTQRPTLQQQAGFCPSPFLEPFLGSYNSAPCNTRSPSWQLILISIQTHVRVVLLISKQPFPSRSPLPFPDNAPFSVSFYSKIPQAFSNSCGCSSPFISYF